MKEAEESESPKPSAEEQGYWFLVESEAGTSRVWMNVERAAGLDHPEGRVTAVVSATWLAQQVLPDRKPQVSPGSFAARIRNTRWGSLFLDGMFYPIATAVWLMILIGIAARGCP